jgi:hypothetical protein
MTPDARSNRAWRIRRVPDRRRQRNDSNNRGLGSPPEVFAERDIDGVLADYSSDAVLFVAGGPLRGPEAIRPLFESLVSEFSKPGSSFTMQQRYIEGDHAYILWTGETADNSYDFATDTFFVRDGKIIAQSFAAKTTPKR